MASHDRLQVDLSSDTLRDLIGGKGVASTVSTGRAIIWSGETTVAVLVHCLVNLMRTNGLLDQPIPSGPVRLSYIELVDAVKRHFVSVCA